MKVKTFNKSIFVITILLALCSKQAKAYLAGKFKINRDYGNTYSLSVPQEFEITLPSSGINVLYPGSFPDKEAYVKLQFIENNELAENLVLKYIKVPLAKEKAERVAHIKKQLIAVFNQYTNAGFIGFQEIKYNNIETFVLNAQVNPYYIQLVGFLNPTSHHCIMAIINIDPKLSPAKSLDDLGKKGLAIEVLRTAKFGRELM